MADSDNILIETAPDTPFPLGRHVWHDPQNRAHRAFAAPPELKPDKDSAWYSPDVYNQLGSSCTFQSNIGMCRSGTSRKTFAPFWSSWDTEEERHAGYLQAQALDPWEGGEPTYAGSSSDAPLKLLRSLGHIKEWKWLFGFDEAKQWSMYNGVFVVGTNWYPSMFRVGADGFIRIVDSEGGPSGGHAWRIVGYSCRRKAFRMVNSWSTRWGQQGRAWISEADLRRLLNEQGEAVTVVV